MSFSEDYVNPMGNIVSHLANDFLVNAQIMDLHSCNGLLAIVLLSKNDRLEFIVYNPTTNQHRAIHHAADSVGFLVALNVVFDPSKSEHYKLVCVWTAGFTDWDTGYYTEKNLISIYASETGTWTDCDEKLNGDYSTLKTYFENGVLWNGDLHWISYWKYTLCLDLGKEVINWTAPSLPIPLGEWKFWYFGVCGESLYVIEVNSPHAVFDVFEMTRDYSQWMFKFHIDLAPLTTLYPTMVEKLWPLDDEHQLRFSIPCFYQDEKENKPRLVISIRGKLIIYDTSNSTVEELANVGQQDVWWKDELIQWKDICQHMETFTFV